MNGADVLVTAIIAGAVLIRELAPITAAELKDRRAHQRTTAKLYRANGGES